MRAAVGRVLVWIVSRWLLRPVSIVYPIAISASCWEVLWMNGCFAVQDRSCEGQRSLFGRVIRLRHAGVDSAESFERGLFLAGDSRL